MTAIQALVLAIVQGAAGLFPVSAHGHAVVIPAWLGWHTDQHAPGFLSFLAAAQLGSAVALVGYFWRDWVAIAAGLVGLGTEHHRYESRRVFLLIVIASIPAALLWLVAGRLVEGVFATPLLAAILLLVNGLMLMAGERSRARATRPLSDLSMPDALVIGLWQCLAILPGLSRSGATMVGGLTRGVGHDDAAHFSFLIAAPALLGVAAAECSAFPRAGFIGADIAIFVMVAVVAGAVAWLSAWFLMRYFRRAANSQALDPFGWYSIVVGALLTVWFLFA